MVHGLSFSVPGGIPPGPDLEPVSAELAGKFSITGPPGNSLPFTFEKSKGRDSPVVKTPAFTALSLFGGLRSQKPHSAGGKKLDSAVRLTWVQIPPLTISMGNSFKHLGAFHHL